MQNSETPKTNPNDILNEMQELYLRDKKPWIVGFSGGKDSTCVAQMVFYMLKNLPEEKRTKTVHIISSNTLVESPFIDRRVSDVLSKMEKSVKELKLPIIVKRLKPILDDTFWINLIGRGYPSPNRWFRWCTDRLKIRPITRYILEQVRQNGEVIVLLGARRSESATRSQTLTKYEIQDFRLRRHTIPGAFVYTPIESFDTKDVWTYLFQVPSLWGDNNKDLITFYRKADGECPLQIDTSTSSCGGSRFGCWVCTVVSRDRSIEGLIESGETWLQPLLDFRDWLKQIRDDKNYRENVRKEVKKEELIAKKLGKEFKSEDGEGHKLLGPFTLKTRHEILKKLMDIQEKVKDKGLVLITTEELKAIETLWIYEGDNPHAMEEILKTSLENGNATTIISREIDNSIYLQEICEENKIPFQLIERLLSVEQDFSTLSKKKDIYARLDKVVEEHVINEMYSGGD